MAVTMPKGYRRLENSERRPAAVTNVPGRTVKLSGTVAAMGRAFGVSLQRYETVDKVVHRGRDGYISIPDKLGDVVEGVFGLDDRPIGGRNIAPALPPRPRTSPVG